MSRRFPSGFDIITIKGLKFPHKILLDSTMVFKQYLSSLTVLSVPKIKRKVDALIDDLCLTDYVVRISVLHIHIWRLPLLDLRAGF